MDERRFIEIGICERGRKSLCTRILGWRGHPPSPIVGIPKLEVLNSGSISEYQVTDRHRILIVNTGRWKHEKYQLVGWTQTWTLQGYKLHCTLVITEFSFVFMYGIHKYSAWQHSNYIQTIPRRLQNPIPVVHSLHCIPKWWWSHLPSVIHHRVQKQSITT